MRRTEQEREEEGSGSRLDPDEVEAIARRVAEILTPRLSEIAPGATRRLLTAAEVSEWWGVDRSWVYAHTTELGAIRLGSGRRPRLRFDPELVARSFDQQAPQSPEVQPRRRARRRSRPMPADSVDLLPLKGDPELRCSTQNRGRPGDAQTPPAAAPKAKASTR
jgi:hypothetical protein